jgi:4-oxalocrotonate tautomerase
MLAPPENATQIAGLEAARAKRASICAGPQPRQDTIGDTNGCPRWTPEFVASPELLLGCNKMLWEPAMPEVYVYALEGRTIDQKRSLVKDITDAVVRNFKVAPEAVMVQIMESAKDSKSKGGVLFSDRSPG